MDFCRIRVAAELQGFREIAGFQGTVILYYSYVDFIVELQDFRAIAGRVSGELQDFSGTLQAHTKLHFNPFHSLEYVP